MEITIFYVINNFHTHHMCTHFCAIFSSPSCFFLSEIVAHEQVVKELDADSVDLGSGLGMDGERFTAGNIPQAVFIQMKVCV